MIEFVFWLSIFLIAYPYLIYPLIMLAIAYAMPKPVAFGKWEPLITILIPAYNEADCIHATIKNKLELEYPRDKLQIIVVSDGSDDGTDEIVQQYSSDGVRLLRRAGREGKAAALNEAIMQATGEIVVFSDANSQFDTNALRYFAENFADPSVGYVTGSLQLVNADNPGVAGSGGGVYLRYENFLRVSETRAGSIIGVNGGVDAIRRELYVNVPKNLITDFVLPLTVIANGKRVVYDARARSCEVANTEISSEFRMRIRVALRALQGLAYMRRLLNPLRFPLASFCLVSHKLLRYMAFIFMLCAFVSNILLAMTSSPYQLLLGIQIAGYAIALLGLYDRLPIPLRRITAAPSYFLMTYIAFAFAFIKYVRGENMATWRPRGG